MKKPYFSILLGLLDGLAHVQRGSLPYMGQDQS